MKNIIKLPNGKLKVKCYWPNSVRIEEDDDTRNYWIYINDDLYELCPSSVTEEEAEMRLHDIMDELWIEGWTEFIRKEI